MCGKGVGPAFAIPKLLKNVGIGQNEIDFYEVEPFYLI
jgi:hypothetical protein